MRTYAHMHAAATDKHISIHVISYIKPTTLKLQFQEFKTQMTAESKFPSHFQSATTVKRPHRTARFFFPSAVLQQIDHKETATPLRRMT